MAALPSVSLRVMLAGSSPDGGDIAAEVARISQPNEIMRNGISLGLLLLAKQIQKERFTGQGPFAIAEHRLGVVTGRLRRDLHAEPAELTATGYKGRIGSIVEYFGAHELGFDGQVTVPAHQRKAYTVEKRGYSVLAQSVRAHTKHLKIKARRPLGTGIEQHAEPILVKQIETAIAAIQRQQKTP